MLYALVNNDYHLYALRRHDIAAWSGSEGVTLITVPHALSPTADTSDFRATHRFDTPLGRGRLLFMLRRYRAQARAVARTLKPGPDDTLVFFTEVEWLNHIVVQRFHRRGARTVLLQDGGLGTYVQMSFSDTAPLSRRERCIQAIYRLLVPGLGRSSVFKVNDVLYPRLPDSAIDAIALYRDVALQRGVPTHCVQPPVRKACGAQRSTVVFLNQPMYYYYQTEAGYLTGLRRLMTALIKGYKTVHFKFHPGESADWKSRIREMLAREFPRINVIDRPGSIEDMVLDYRPEALASYFSAGALSMEYEDIEPLYLYHLLDDVKDQPAFTGATHILRSWGYHFVQSDDEIRSGYRSGITTADKMTGVNLRELLDPPAG